MPRAPKLLDKIKVQRIDPVTEKRHTVEITRQEALLELVRQGCTHKAAAVQAGISESTFYNWRDKGRQAKSGIYRAFADALEAAEAQAEVSLTLQMRQHARNDPRACRWMLERRFPENWRERKQVDATVSVPQGDGPSVALVVNLASMAPDQLAALSGCNLDDMDGLELPTDDPYATEQPDHADAD